MSNTIDSAKQMIHSRLAEIRDEEKRLEKALASLSPDGIRRRRTRSSSTAKKTQSPSRRRRRGGRADQVTKIVTKQPGLKASEIAKAAKIGSSQTHTILAKLVSDGKITKGKDKTYSPATPA